MLNKTIFPNYIVFDQFKSFLHFQILSKFFLLFASYIDRDLLITFSRSLYYINTNIRETLMILSLF